MHVATDAHLGKIVIPGLDRLISLPRRSVRRAVQGEFGLFVAKQQRPLIVDAAGRLVPEAYQPARQASALADWRQFAADLGLPVRPDDLLIPAALIGGYLTLWASVSHNERVDAGAQYQAQQCFAGGGSPAAPSATVYFNVIAHANGTLTKAKGDQSLGSTSASVTTNEYTTIGMSRATATTPVGGDYTAPSSLGGTFSQVIKKTFTASGSGTVYGAGVFNSTTVSGSILYVEDNYSSTAVLVSSDTLSDTITISN